MDCERFDRVSLDLLYDELDELNRAAAQRHLHHCTRCQGIWNRLRATKELSLVPEEIPPADLFESILRAEQEANKELPWRERFGRAVSVLAEYAMRPQLAMAALLVLMLGSSVLLMRSSPSGKDQVGVTEVGTPALEAEDRGQERSAVVAAARDLGLPEPDSAAPMEAEASAEKKPSTETEGEAYRSAMAAYQDGRYAEAERLFSELSALGGEKAAVSALHEAHSARNGSGCQRASALYDRVSVAYRGSTVADEAAWQAASCYSALGQKARARAHLAELATRPAFQARASSLLDDLSQGETEVASKGASLGAAQKSAGDSPPERDPRAKRTTTEPGPAAEAAPKAPAAASAKPSADPVQ